MHLLTEMPWFSQPVILFARKDGEYVRPIIGDIVDVRIEDIIGRITTPRMAARLPDIPKYGQVGRYLTSTMGSIDRVDVTAEELEQLLSQGGITVLPDSPKSEYWQKTQAPWWEFAMVVDTAGNYIKAPLIPRHGEPTADEIDERLDEYEENVGHIRVYSPITLDKKMKVTEDFQEKLWRALS